MKLEIMGEKESFLFRKKKNTKETSKTERKGRGKKENQGVKKK